MSFTASLIKTAIKLTPKKPVQWVANFVMKDIAELVAFDFDIDARNSYVQIQLKGESETIEVWIEDFGILHENESYQFIIRSARSNRIWLNNLLARITGKAWQIPNIPEFAAYMALAAEVFNAGKNVEQTVEEANS